MTETTTAAQSFTDMSDFVARAHTGDTFRDHDAASITDYTVAAIEDAEHHMMAGGEADRVLVLRYVQTSHKGRPHYRYLSVQHTWRAWSTAMGHAVDLNLGQPMTAVHQVTGAKRRSAKGLAAAHAHAMAQVELTA